MHLKVSFSRDGMDILTLKLDPAGATPPEVLSGNSSWFDFTYEPFSTQTGNPVSWRQPELWVEALTEAYNAGDSGITVRSEQVTVQQEAVSHAPVPGPETHISPHVTDGLPQAAGNPERVNGLVLSTWGRRVGAYLLDGLFLWLITAGIFALLAVLLSSGGDPDSADLGFVRAIVFTMLLSFPITVCYYLFTMNRKGSRNGQSFGKQIMNIAVIREDGQDVTAGFAFMRQIVVMGFLLGLLSGVSFGILAVVDYLSPLWNKNSQAYHDRVVKSYVVRTDVR